MIVILVMVSIVGAIVVFSGCEEPRANNQTTSTKQLYSEKGIVNNVEFVPEDSSYVYAIVHFEDRVVKFRNGYNNYISIPTGRLIEITFDRNLYITKIEDLTKE